MIAILLMKWKSIKIISDVRHRIITSSTPPPLNIPYFWVGGGKDEHDNITPHVMQSPVALTSLRVTHGALRWFHYPLSSPYCAPSPTSHLLTVSSRLYGPHKVLSHRVNPSRAAPLNYICLLCFARRGGWRGNGRRNWISRKVFGSHKDCVTLFFQ